MATNQRPFTCNAVVNDRQFVAPCRDRLREFKSRPLPFRIQPDGGGMRLSVHDRFVQCKFVRIESD